MLRQVMSGWLILPSKNEYETTAPKTGTILQIYPPWRRELFRHLFSIAVSKPSRLPRSLEGLTGNLAELDFEIFAQPAAFGEFLHPRRQTDPFLFFCFHAEGSAAFSVAQMRDHDEVNRKYERETASTCLLHRSPARRLIDGESSEDMTRQLDVVGRQIPSSRTTQASCLRCTPHPIRAHRQDHSHRCTPHPATMPFTSPRLSRTTLEMALSKTARIPHTRLKDDHPSAGSISWVELQS